MEIAAAGFHMISLINLPSPELLSSAQQPPLQPVISSSSSSREKALSSSGAGFLKYTDCFKFVQGLDSASLMIANKSSNPLLASASEPSEGCGLPEDLLGGMSQNSLVAQMTAAESCPNSFLSQELEAAIFGDCGGMGHNVFENLDDGFISSMQPGLSSEHCCTAGDLNPYHCLKTPPAALQMSSTTASSQLQHSGFLADQSAAAAASNFATGHSSAKMPAANHQRGLSQYFWQINSHSTSNKNLQPAAFSSEPEGEFLQVPPSQQHQHTYLTEESSSHQQMQAQNTMLHKQQQLGSSKRNMRAFQAENELEKKESGMLRQDVKERMPDPMKLIILREKMEEITKMMDSLHSMRENTDALKAMKKKEKNRLASKCCRLKKKALFEANVIIRNGLDVQKQNLQFLLDKLREMIREHLNQHSQSSGAAANDTTLPNAQNPSLRMKVDELIYFVASKTPQVAGRTQDYVNEVIENAPMVYNMQMKGT